MILGALRRTHAILLFSLLISGLSGSLQAEILSLRSFPCVEPDPAIAGTLDWVRFRPAAKVGEDWDVDDSRSGGAGIRWIAGASRISGDSRLSLEFPGSATGERMASIVMNGSTALTATARQAGVSQTLKIGSSENVVQVKFSGEDALQIDLSPQTGDSLGLVGLSATLSESGYWWIRDSRLALVYIPVSGDELRRKIYLGESPDYLQTARAYADAMLLYGRDRYGEVHSPLFSSILTRDQEPAMPPSPLFGPQTELQRQSALRRRQTLENAGHSVGPFEALDFMRILNYPLGLGDEGPYKVTLYGADPYEDRELYATLFEMSRITGSKRYRTAAEEAIRWWFRNTQGPTGLYPWGTHLGWDLESDRPTYFSGPSQYLYQANNHEVADFVPFLEYLSELPAEEPGANTPLEKYAFGIWNMHFWNKEKAYFSRHGDYTGEEEQTGLEANPAHLAFYLRVWVAAFLHTDSPEVRSEISSILNKVADMALTRTERWGFLPMDLRPDLEQTDAGSRIPQESLRLAHHAAYLAAELEAELPAVAAKLSRFSEMHIGSQSREVTMRNLDWAETIGDVSFLQGTRDTRLPTAGRPALAASVLSEDYATQILSLLRLYRENGQDADLRFARVYARLAYARFCDGKSPLPRAFAVGAPIQTASGGAFPDFYFRGAKLMRAFAELGEILRSESRGKLAKR